MKCFLDVTSLRTKCFLNITSLWTQCFLNITCLWPGCFLRFLVLVHLCDHFPHNLFSEFCGSDIFQTNFGYRTVWCSKHCKLSLGSGHISCSCCGRHLFRNKITCQFVEISYLNVDCAQLSIISSLLMQILLMSSHKPLMSVKIHFPCSSND